MDIAGPVGADDIGDARGIAVFDFDNDGDLDIAVNHNIGDNGAETFPAVLLRNDIKTSNNYLAVSLEGTLVNRDAIGAKITLQAGDLSLTRLKGAGSSYASQHDARIYFGLGTQTRVDKLVVTWPGGRQETFEQIEPNQMIHIVEGKGIRMVADMGGIQPGGAQ